MENYEIIERIGGGTFADVYKAKEKDTGELVAIKTLKRKYKKLEDCLELGECKSLKKLLDDSISDQKGFNNIIKLKTIIFVKKTGSCNLIFEYMKQDLLELMKSKEPGHLDESEIKDIIYQTLLGLAHMHKYGYFHRDMKPENLLINDKIVKIADFGLAREIRSIPPYTEYVSTRYYRAPECILKSSNYNSPMDIWAVGCIMAEMFLHPKPLFYGQNEKEVLNKICSILGTPNHDTWAKGIQQANIIGLKLPNNSGTDLAKIIPNASTKAIEIMKQMLQWDPNKRPTAISLLNNPYFSNEDYNSYNLDLSKFFENLEKSKTRNEKNIDGELIRKSISLLKQSKGDDNNYLKILNDTDGLVKLLTQLKKEKIQDEKDYEKEVNKFGGNECDISNINYNGLDLTNLSINKSNNLFNQSLKITNMNNINLNNTKNNNNNLVDMDFSYNVTTIGNNSLKNSSAQNEQNDVNVQNTDTLNINEEMESESKIKEECNNYGENFEIKLKNEPISNRIRSARKFLEENESKFLCDKPKKIKSNDYIFKFDKEENLNPNKNDYLYLNQKNEDKELNELLEKTRKQMGVVDSDFIKNDVNFINNNSKGFKMFNDNEPLFFGSRRNHIPNLNNAWGI
jgi:serine/threonine protein kinase